MKQLAAAVALAAGALFLQAGPAQAAGTCVAGGCHRAIVGSKFLHGPVAAEEAGAEGCRSCHVPAGAACTAAKGGKYTFKAKQDRLCLLCHERGTATQHTRSRSDCLSCHDPHASQESDMLLKPDQGGKGQVPSKAAPAGQPAAKPASPPKPAPPAKPAPTPKPAKR